MSAPEPGLDAVARAAAELVPQLTERLRRHGLGEIEVAHGELRLRVAAGGAPATDTRALVHETGASVAAATPRQEESESAGAVGVSSPAVGFFVYAEGLGPGQEVDKGDPLGHVEMLGVRHEVRAPRSGTVRHLVAESGEAVEYGQVVVELEAADASA